MERSKILIVEDSWTQAEGIRLLVESHGHLIKTAASGKEALQTAAEFLPDVIILDLLLPDIPGIEVARQLRSNPQTSEKSIIIVSRLNSEDDKVEGLESGADDYITKPIRPRELLARVRTQLRTQRLMKELQKKNEELIHLAACDPLTGLYNRLFLREYMLKQYAVWQRYQTALSVIMFDIDHFKQVNDRYGHMIGDEVLKELALVISKILRSADVFARFGGEEFLIVLPNTGREEAKVVAEKIRRLVESTRFSGLNETLTISLGVAQLEAGMDIEALLKAADEKLYAAKEAGRNRVEA